ANRRREPATFNRRSSSSRRGRKSCAAWISVSTPASASSEHPSPSEKNASPRAPSGARVSRRTRWPDRVSASHRAAPRYPRAPVVALPRQADARQKRDRGRAQHSREAPQPGADAAERRPRLRVLAPLDDERRRSLRVPSQPEREARRDVGVQVALERHDPSEQLALERRKEPERRSPDPLPIERIVGVEQEVHVARTDFRVGEAQAEL